MTLAKAAGLAVLLVASVLAVAILSVRKNEKPGSPAASLPSASAIPDAKPERRLSCRIVARQSIWASTPLTGTVETVLADVGQTVTDGQVLARIAFSGVTPAAATLEEQGARAHAAEIAAQLTAAKTESAALRAAAARAQASVAKAEPVFRRQELLNKAGATPRLVYEKARADYERAAAELAGAEEAARQAENLASSIGDRQREAQRQVQQKSRAAVAAATGLATAEIHTPAAGLVVFRTIAAGESVTDANRAQLFQIAIEPRLLRAEFEPEAALRAGQSLSIETGGAKIRAIVNDIGAADFESHTEAVLPGSPCSAVVLIK